MMKSYELRLIEECAQKIEGNLKNLARELKILKKASVAEISDHILTALSANVINYLNIVIPENEEHFRGKIFDFQQEVGDMAEKLLSIRSGVKNNG